MTTFTCPSCHSELINEKEKNKFLICRNNNCLFSEKSFPVINGIPLLIPFGLKNCILEEKIKDEFVNFGIKKRTQDSKIKNIVNFLRDFFIGTNIVSKKNYEFLSMNLEKKANILIIGGGTLGAGSEIFFANCKKKYVNVQAIDIYLSKNLTAIADAHYLPYCDDKFDLVIIQAVLEHVINPNKVVNEISRVLRNNGIVYAETPFMQSVHEGIYDFTRYSHSAHRFLFKEFIELKSGYIGGAFSSVLFLLSYAISGFFRTNYIGKLFRIIFTRFFRFLDLLISDKYNYDVGCGFYFIGKKDLNLQKEFKGNELIKYYRGAQ